MDAAEAAGAISAETEAAMEAASCDTLFTEGRALRDANPALAPRLDPTSQTLRVVRPSGESPDLIDPGPPLWEQAAAIVVIMMLTQAFIGPVFAPSQEETPILRLVWLPVYAVIAGLIALRPAVLVRAWPAWLILAVLVLQAFASKWWSIDPGVTQRRVIAMAISSAFAIYLGVAFQGRHLPRMLMLASLIMGLGSLVMVFVNPTIGVHQLENAGLWRGLWYEKNQMGLVMSAGAVAAAACLASGDQRRRLPAITLAVCAVLVLATQSKTSLLCLMLGVGAVGGLW
eukprot:gene12137-16201_t